MDRLEPHAIASILASTSTSKLAGLLCADQDYKTRAAEQIAHDIITRIHQPRPDRNQLALPF